MDLTKGGKFGYNGGRPRDDGSRAMLTDPALWARLVALDLDDPTAELAFSSRLAAENGWTRSFARRVIGEYKRFVYLSQLGKGMVTPSDAVDQAWHLHLTYTRHYWDVLCGETLGRPLHHEPTRGGADEDARYRRCYERTLALYATEFGTAPPPILWSVAGARIDEAKRRVSIPQHRVKLVGRAARLALMALAFLVGFASLALAASEGDLFGGLAIVAALIIAVVTVVRLVLSRFTNHGTRRRNNGGPGGGGFGCGGPGGGTGGSGSSGDGGGGGGCGGGGD